MSRPAIQPGEFEAAYLLEVAHSARPPDDIGPGEFEHREFAAIDGWRVVIFYDGGELDYIDEFVAPDGRALDFWEWDEATPGRNALIAWRGMRDTAPLLRSLGCR